MSSHGPFYIDVIDLMLTKALRSFHHGATTPVCLMEHQFAYLPTVQLLVCQQTKVICLSTPPWIAVQTLDMPFAGCGVQGQQACRTWPHGGTSVAA